MIPGVDIAINLDPDGGKTNLARQDPTGIGRHDLAPFADLVGGIGMSQDGTDDDYWILHFAAADLPAPPYNVLEGIWTKNGRSDASYTGGLLLSSAADPNLVEPFIVFDAPRLVAGGPGGNTGTTEITDVRDRFNVTINDGRELYFVVNQPESVGSLIAEDYRDRHHPTKQFIMTTCGFVVKRHNIKSITMTYYDIVVEDQKANAEILVRLRMDPTNTSMPTPELNYAKLKLTLKKKTNETWVIKSTELVEVNKKPVNWNRAY